MSSPPVQFYSSQRNAGQKTAYRRYSRLPDDGGVPLFLVQGMSAVGTVDWHDLACALQKSRTVISFDNRDMGESTVSQSQPFTLLDLAMDVVELAQHLQYAEIDILGHSMGGMICQTLITTPSLPIRIRRCCLGATSPSNPRSDLGKAVAAQMKKLSADNSSKSKAQRDRETTEVFMQYCYDPDWQAANPQLYERRVNESLSSRRPAKTVALQQRAIGRYDVRKQLALVPASLPILVIHGMKDVAVYPEHGQELLSCVKHAKTARCPRDDFGHNWYDYFSLDHWVRTLDGFLNAGDVKARL